jgi:hypothetical protein
LAFLAAGTPAQRHQRRGRRHGRGHRPGRGPRDGTAVAGTAPARGGPGAGRAATTAAGEGSARGMT